MIKTKKKHGYTKKPEYRAWASMKARCLNPNNPSFKEYGGRGITVSEEWNNSFNCFISDMGDRPSLAHSLERIDNDKGYSKHNCCWATRKVQHKNKRNNVLYEYCGEKFILRELCDLLNIHYQTVQNRVSVHKWDINRALTFKFGIDVCVKRVH